MPKVIKLAKPQAEQAVTVAIDGATKIDFADIANEKITLVRIGDRLIILFDGGATVSMGPFFDATGKPLANIALELAPDRIVSSSEFAALFPITSHQSVLPAAGNAGPSSSGGFYAPPVTVAPLSPEETTPFTSGSPTPFTIISVLSAPPQSNNTSQAIGDSSVPQGPSAPDLIASSDSGNPGDNVTNVTSPTFRVILDPKTAVGDTVELLLGGASLAHPLIVTITAADVATGSIFMTVTAGDLGADGSKTVSAVFLDATGNTSTTPTLSMVLDTVTPVGVTPDLESGSDSGTSNVDNLTNATGAVFKVALSGTVAVGDVIELKSNGVALAHPATHTVTAADITAGSALVSVTAGDLGADGVKSIAAQLTDLAGNTSSTAALSITLDTTADVGSDLTLTMADASINNAEKSAVAFSVSGVDSDVAGADAKVTFTDSDNNTVTVLASAGVADLSSLADGPISAVLSVKDTAGNIATAAQSIALDTRADVSPGATLVVGGSQSGSLVVDGGHHTVSFAIEGLDADSTGTVTFSDGVNPAVTANVSANGTYTIDLSSLTGGPITSEMAIGDVAGNSASVTGNTLYATIQAAINAAADGDTIMVAAGTYNEALTINKGVTILGANAGIAGDAAGRGAETIITGQSSITTGSKVVVNGVEFLDSQAYTLSIGDNFVALKVLVNSTAGHVIENSVFMRDPVSDPAGYTGSFIGGALQPTHRALELSSVTAGTTVTVTNNLFTGTNTTNPYAGDSWRTGVYSNGGAGTTLIENNTFSNVRAGINADDFSSTVTINGNTFSHDGTAIAVGVGSSVNPVTTITNNIFSQVDGDFNFQNLTTPVVFNAVASGNTTTAEPLEVLGSSAGDTITTGQGNDAVTGNGGADTISTGAGNDTIIGFSGADNVDGGADTDTIVLTATAADLTSATDAQIVNVEAVSAATNAAGIVIDLHNQSEGFAITGGLGNDTITGGAGADTINAGTGIDTVSYTTSQASHTITWNGTTATITGGTDTGTTGDTVTNAGVIAFTDHKVFLVGAGSDYTTIQAAINAAAAGDTIMIADGTYAEHLIVDKALTITGSANVIVQGTFKTDNAITGSVADYLQTAPGYTGAAGNGITINASNVTISGIKVAGFNAAIELGDNISNTIIKNVTLTESVTGINKATDANVDHLTLQGGTITDTYMGVVFAKSPVQGEGLASYINVTGTTFDHITQKGLYIEALDHALITGIVMNNVGQYGGGVAFGANGANGAGIDINLKYDVGVYTDIKITDFIFTNVGASNGLGSSHANAGAITVKVRDDGATYGANPADFTGTIIIDNGSITGTSTGIRAGEAGKNVLAPAITIDNVEITGAVHNSLHGDVANVTQSVMTVSGTAGDNVIVASPTSIGQLVIDGEAGNDTITAGQGNDTITGGLGSDTIHGAAGNDTASYSTVQAGHTITWNGTTATVTGGSDTGATADTIDGVGTIAFTDHKVFLVGAGSDYTTIQAAINAASDGDTIMVAAGTYNEALTINKGVTILGANAGIAGDAAGRGAETIITGQSSITTGSKVVVNGVEFLDSQAYTLSIGDNFVALKVLVNSTAGHVIENSVFMRDPVSDPAGYTGSFIGGALQPTHRALELSSVTAGTTVTVTNNLFTGTNTTNPYAGDSWRTGVYSNGGAGTTLIENNTFSNVRAGINADDFSSTVTINGNTFSHDGTAIAVGVGSSVNPVTTITNNIFSQVDGDFNFQNLTTPVVFNAVASGNTTTAEPLEVLGSSAGDTITTGQGNDAVTGNGGADTISTGAGNDTIIGFSGADNVDGGADTDTIVLTATAADLTSATDAQIVNVEAVSAATNAAGIVIDLHNQSEGFAITGGLGNDTITGGAGADTINAGTGIDTVSYTTSQASHTITWNGTTATITGGTDTGTTGDTVTNAGVIAFTDHKVFLVGAGSDYTTIQAAINAAAAGDTIMIADGTYAEHLIVDKALTITGSANVIVQGTFKTDNAITGSVADYLQTAPGYTGAAGNGITINASNVTISGIKVAGFNAAIELGDNISNTIIKNVTLTESVTGINKATDANVDHLTLQGGTITDTYMGVVFAKSPVQGEGLASYINVTGTTFDHITQKGLYIEALDHALITGIVMNNVGQYGGGVAFGANGANGAGIDINLKYDVGVYTDIKITDFIFTNVGASNGLGSSHANAGAITVKVRDDGATYGANPADFTGTIIIDNGSITGTSTGIRAGEAGKNVLAPAITIDNVEITGAVHNSLHGDVANVTQSVMTVSGTAGDNVIVASPTSIGQLVIDGEAGNDTITAGQGNDTITGGLGSDTIHGAAGNDTASYSTVQAGHTITWNGTTATVTGGSDTGATADTIDGVGTIAFTDHKVFLVGAGSDYTTIQAAINAASDGDTIMVAAGTYNEALTINKGVTILGANAGIAGDAAGRGAETIITGQSSITTGSKVVVNGVEFLDSQAYTLSIGDNFVALKVLVNSTAGHVIENSVFMRDPVSDPAGYTGSFIGGALQPTHRALELSSVTAGTTVTVTNNLFTGTNTTNPYAGDSWRTGVYSNGGAGTTLIENNTFSNVRAGINADDFSSTVTINGNTFSHDGTAIAVGVGSSVNPVTTITNNIFSQVDGDFNFQNLTTPVVFNAVASGNTTTAEPLEVLGSSAGDTITTGQGNDAVTGNGGADTISTGAGNDTIIGFSGADNVDGGADTDTIVLTATAADLTSATDAQIVNVEAVSAATNAAGIVIDLHNQSEGFAITGGLGNDTITGGAGADTINAGTGIDTVSYTTSQASHTITWNGTTATITGGTDTGTTGDTVTNAGVIAFTDHKVFLVGAGSDYTTIQAAINAAAAGDTIMIADGTYAEHLIVDKALTITGSANVIVQGTFKTDNAITGSVADYLQTAPGYTGAAGNGITINASNVTISGIKVAGFNAAIELGDNISNTIIKNVTLTESVTGINKATDANVDHLTLQGGTITDTYMGVVFAKSPVQGEGLASYINVTGTTFDHITQKGLYIEALDHALITGIVMNNVGQYGGGVAFGANGANGAGIDINLKYDVGVYTDIKITDFIFTNVGASNGLGSSHANAGAITVKVRDDGATYGANPADFTGTIIIDNGSITGTSTGIRAGEAGKNVLAPAITIDNVEITGAVHNSLHGDVANVTQSVMTVSGTAGDNVIVASPTSIGQLVIDGEAGNDTITAGQGNDTITGGLGSDTIHGAAGNDTASYSTVQAGHTITWNGTTATVTGGTDTGATADTIDGVGTIAFTDHKVFLVGAGSDYTTIQAAINAASDGDTIMVAAGTYNEALTINKGVTILGANAGIAGDAAGRGAETIIDWASGSAATVTTTGQVTFDGLAFHGTHVISASFADTHVAFTNSTFDIMAAGNNSNNFYFNQPDAFSFTNNHVDVTGYTGAFFQPVGTSGDPMQTTVTITGNSFTGHAGAYVPGDDNVVPVIANLSDVNGTVTSNTFHNVDIGILVGNGSGPLAITDNTFDDMHRVIGSTGGGYAAGVVFYQPAPFGGEIDVTNNSFSDMDAGIRVSNVPGSSVATSSIDINSNTFFQVDHPGYQPVDGVLHFTNSTIDGVVEPSIYLSGAGNDTIGGTAGADHYLYASPTPGIDHLTSFDASQGDSIDFLIANFTGTSAGALSANQFGTSADNTFGSADERFHYDTSTSTLSYDSNGSAAGGLTAVLAVLDNAATVQASNIHGV